MYVDICVRMLVEDCEPKEFHADPQNMRDCTVKAIYHALKAREDDGFYHPLDDVVSMMVDEVKLNPNQEQP